MEFEGKTVYRNKTPDPPQALKRLMLYVFYGRSFNNFNFSLSKKSIFDPLSPSCHKICRVSLMENQKTSNVGTEG